jgi:hypothetical protein
MICDKAEVVFTTLFKDFHEVPQWTGSDIQDGSTYILTANQEDGSWTLVQTMNEIACVMGVGKGSVPRFGTPV